MITGGYSVHPGDGRVIYTPGEYEQARARPPALRTPLPAPGDHLLYRHIEASDRVYRVTVVSVQDPEDISDGNLFYFQTDQLGRPVHLEGKQVLAQAKDPWPLVRLELEEELREAGRWLPAGAQVDTREARMRGSCGWLPLDWETRPQPAPPAFVVVRAE